MRLYIKIVKEIKNKKRVVRYLWKYRAYFFFVFFFFFAIFLTPIFSIVCYNLLNDDNSYLILLFFSKKESAMLAGRNARSAINASWRVNDKFAFSGYCFHRADLCAPKTFSLAGTWCAFSVFPAAFFIINCYSHN